MNISQAIRKIVIPQIYLWLFTLFFGCGIISIFYGYFRTAYIFCMAGLLFTLCAGYFFGIYAVRKAYGLDQLSNDINKILKKNHNITRQDIIQKGIEYYAKTKEPSTRDTASNQKL